MEKMTTQRVFSTTRFLSKTGKTHVTRSRFKKLMEDALVENKHNTQKRKSIKKKAVIKIEVPTEKVMHVDEYEKTESKNERDSNFDDMFTDESDEDIDRSVESMEAKAQNGVVVSPEKGKAKGILIKKPVSTGGEKEKRGETTDSKGLGPSSKTNKTSKAIGVLVKGTGPGVKASTSKEKGKILLREERKKLLRPKKS